MRWVLLPTFPALPVASLDHFIRVVPDGRPPEVTLGIARNAHAIVDAAKRSAGSNQPVSLTPPG